MKITRTIGSFTTVNGVRYTLARIAENGREVWEGGVVGGTVFSTVEGERGHPAYLMNKADQPRDRVTTFAKAATSAQTTRRKLYEQRKAEVDAYEAALHEGLKAAAAAARAVFEKEA